MKKTLSALSAALALAAAGSAPGIAHAAAEVVGGTATRLALQSGQGRLIRLDRPAATVFIADPKVADVQVKSPTLIYVVGKSAGSTSLFAVDGHDQMIANLGLTVGFDEAGLREALQRQAPNSHIEVTTANNALVLTGKVASAAEGADILRTAAQFIQGDDKERASRLINRLTVEASNQINLRVRVAEVSHQANDILGFNWESMASIGQGVLGLATGRPVFSTTTPRQVIRSGTADNVLAGYTHGSTDINVLIDALKQRGLVSILAEPNLTAVSGEPASFLAGGEYPIPVPQPGGGSNQITIQYKKYGVSLDFVATILEGGRITLNVRPEVSQLSDVGAITLNGITVPALTTRRAETTVDLASGQSFAIGGLLQNTVSQDVKKFPLLGDAPILGALFRSKSFQKSESELVIIVTPYLVKAVDQKLATPADLFRPSALAAEPTAAAATTVAPIAKSDAKTKG
ncbi:MAG: pilus assembly protein CpaC [Phenylobacterium sp.]|jgi:pilus assembly protein CpaC|nr:pilus assembly protein CpaC [Phenylobacterium sp.]